MWPIPKMFWNVVACGLMVGLFVVNIMDRHWLTAPICAMLALANLWYIVPEMIRLWFGEKQKEVKGEKGDKP